MSTGYSDAAARAFSGPGYMPGANPGSIGGGTYTGQSDVEPTIEAYENIFGPAARDIKLDLQRFKRHGRWHLPDILKGPNQYLTDRVDGLITDATNSPFTSRILPYKYITNVDGKIKWNVWSFDEGFASRVPYEAAARTLQQSKRSYSGYAVRHGLAMVLEHNFMMTPQGRENFKNQLNQMIGSIQMTNDLDVHVALIQAPSYERVMRERYVSDDKTPEQLCREYVDLFGFVQKNPNALDILIEESKAILRTWGAAMPDFMLCNSKLTFNLQMTPDRTNFLTQGPEGQKRLKQGPNIDSYRGLSIIPSRSFSMEVGAHPRDMLRRRVRTAEYYRIPPSETPEKYVYQLYNEGRDSWFSLRFDELVKMAGIKDARAVAGGGPRWQTALMGHLRAAMGVPGAGAAMAAAIAAATTNASNSQRALAAATAALSGGGGASGGGPPTGAALTRARDVLDAAAATHAANVKILHDLHSAGTDHNLTDSEKKCIELVIIRPNIEHYMFGIIMGLGGESLGSTFWGQTELSCYDDSQHGIWGMSYKYHERAIVINEKNLVRLWDIGYDGYVGGKGEDAVDWTNDVSLTQFKNATGDVTRPYMAQSMMVMAFAHPHGTVPDTNWPSPLVFNDVSPAGPAPRISLDSDDVRTVPTDTFRVFNKAPYTTTFEHYAREMPDFSMLHRIRKNAGQASVENESKVDSIAFQGSMRVITSDTQTVVKEIAGSGHHGPDFVGCSSLRSGKGYKMNSQPGLARLI